MKRCCKNVDILSDGFIERATYEALDEKWKRNDVAKYFSGFTKIINKTRMKKMLKEPENRILIDGLISTSAETIRFEIQNRCLSCGPIQYELRQDGNSGKIREIGKECIKQLILDEAACEGCEELWKKKIGYHQYASIKGKGQKAGKEAIEKQIRRYYAVSRHAWKGDIRRCYESVDIRRLKHMLKRDIKNEALLYLLFFLIGTYRQGLNIGSGLSQFLCNYYLARAYHYVLSLHKTRKHRNGSSEEKKLICFALFYMDDILLTGARESDVKRAAKLLEKFLLKDYGLTIKPDAELFPIDYRIRTDKTYRNYREQDKAERRGKPIDMMGFVIYRNHTEIRRRIFLRGRRAFMSAWRHIMAGREIPLKTAQRCVSYYGWFENTDAEYAMKKYNIRFIHGKCREVIGRHAKSEIYGKAAASEMAAG